ncbi:MFS transporter [Alicyclobacillus mengziensis]|uniref:MFS transporter n=1 Tax=Alicyclobacillus mengziensis TaxID=2931921 RepID=A0A9X7VZR1_9BACL|nr:MFS transporter [Alicyclobacillus mengziensis]QSO47842.1 MFS transporter [Alicyclobacillus mengziensis]
MGSQSSSRRHQGMLWGMGLGGFLVNADNRAIAPMLPAMATTLHVSTSTAALLVSAYSIPYGLFQLVYGPIADRIGKIRTILIALGLFSVGTVICGVVHTFAWLLALRFITGMFAAGIIPTTLAQIGDLFELAERPRAIAFFMSLTTSGQALGIVIGGLLAQFLSYRYLFILIGLAAIPTLIGLLQRQKRGSSTETSSSAPTAVAGAGAFWAKYRTLLSKRTSWLIYMLILFEGFAFYAGFTFLGVYGVSVIHLSYLTIGLLTATYSGGAFVGSRTFNWVLGKMTTRLMPVLGATLMTAAFALDWTWHSTIVLMWSFIVLGLGFSYCHSTLQTYATDLLPSARATAMSVFAFSLFTGSGLGPMAAGAVFSGFGWDGLLGSVTAAMGLFALFTTLLIRQPIQKVSQTQSSSLQS